MTKKGKELWTMFKRGFVLFFILLVIGSFVVSLAYSPWSSHQDLTGYRVAKVKDEVYSYQPNTPYYYLYSEVKKNLADSLKSQLDPAMFNQYVISKSVDYLVRSATVYQFARDIGVAPSQDSLRRIIEITTRSPLYRAPDQGMLDFAAMQYDLNAMEGDNGDILNVSGLPTYAELYSFYEMENFTHSAEFLYLDVTNFIVNRLTTDDIKGFYDDNFGRYVKELSIDELSTGSKLMAFNICRDVQTDGWEKTIDKYKGKANYLKSEKISDAHGTTTRFAAALKLKKGAVSQKPVFENREYHVIMLGSYPAYNDLNPENRKTVEIEFINLKYNELRSKYDGDIKKAVENAEASLKISPDFKKAASVSGFIYLNSDKVNPLSPVLADEKGNQATLPILENKDLADFIFTSKPLSVSKTYYTDGYIVIAKVLKGSTLTNIDYKNLVKVFPSVRRYKSIVTLGDWSKSLEKRYPHTIYEDDLKNLQQVLKGQ